MKLLETLDLERSEEGTREFETRTAVRVVLVSPSGLIALMHARKANYYKLPGGGVEEGETSEQALRRECLEETGCTISNVFELGEVREIRRAERMIQISLCFMAIAGECSTQALTTEEIEQGFSVIWLPYEEALSKVATPVSAGILGEYISRREAIILRQAYNRYEGTF